MIETVVVVDTTTTWKASIEVDLIEVARRRARWSGRSELSGSLLTSRGRELHGEDPSAGAGTLTCAALTELLDERARWQLLRERSAVGDRARLSGEYLVSGDSKYAEVDDEAPSRTLRSLDPARLKTCWNRPAGRSGDAASGDYVECEELDEHARDWFRCHPHLRRRPWAWTSWFLRHWIPSAEEAERGTGSMCRG